MTAGRRSERRRKKPSRQSAPQQRPARPPPRSAADPSTIRWLCCCGCPVAALNPAVDCCRAAGAKWKRGRVHNSIIQTQMTRGVGIQDGLTANIRSPRACVGHTYLCHRLAHVQVCVVYLHVGDARALTCYRLTGGSAVGRRRTPGRSRARPRAAAAACCGGGGSGCHPHRSRRGPCFRRCALSASESQTSLHCPKPADRGTRCLSGVTGVSARRSRDACKQGSDWTGCGNTLPLACSCEVGSIWNLHSITAARRSTGGELQGACIVRA